MHLRIKGDVSNEDFITYSLKRCGEEIALCAQDGGGVEWYVLLLKPDGTFRRCGHCLVKGIKVDKEEKIIESEFK